MTHREVTSPQQSLVQDTQNYAPTRKRSSPEFMGLSQPDTSTSFGTGDVSGPWGDLGYERKKNAPVERPPQPPTPEDTYEPSQDQDS